MDTYADIRQFMMDRIEGILGTLDSLYKLNTIDLLKIYIHITKGGK